MCAAWAACFLRASTRPTDEGRMPFTYSIQSVDAADGRTMVRLTATAPVSADDAYDLFSALSLEASVGPGSVMLVDATGGNGPPNPRRVQDMVQGLWALKQKGIERIAVIAPGDSTYGS